MLVKVILKIHICINKVVYIYVLIRPFHTQVNQYAGVSVSGPKLCAKFDGRT